mmetsp:Transcript_9800/g.12246  ORF Transcript_9800/g.12246 Transcript_9800/m.12246 type:complete len:254 (+) Transcript_9800:1229-1990(+)
MWLQRRQMCWKGLLLRVGPAFSFCTSEMSKTRLILSILMAKIGISWNSLVLDLLVDFQQRRKIKNSSSSLQLFRILEQTSRSHFLVMAQGATNKKFTIKLKFLDWIHRNLSQIKFSIIQRITQGFQCSSSNTRTLLLALLLACFMVMVDLTLVLRHTLDFLGCSLPSTLVELWQLQIFEVEGSMVKIGTKQEQSTTNRMSLMISLLLHNIFKILVSPHLSNLQSKVDQMEASWLEHASINNHSYLPLLLLKLE